MKQFQKEMQGERFGCGNEEDGQMKKNKKRQSFDFCLASVARRERKNVSQIWQNQAMSLCENNYNKPSCSKTHSSYKSPVMLSKTGTMNGNSPP